MNQNAEWAQRANRSLVGNYKPQPIAIERGEGCLLFDADGREYLDLMGGIATTALGHCHPRIVAALADQSHRLWHVSNLFFTEPQVKLAEGLIAHSFADRVFFCNSGAEANEAALKIGAALSQRPWRRSLRNHCLRSKLSWAHAIYRQRHWKPRLLERVRTASSWDSLCALRRPGRRQGAAFRAYRRHHRGTHSRRRRRTPGACWLSGRSARACR